jgi:hypothetical protein
MVMYIEPRVEPLILLPRAEMGEHQRTKAVFSYCADGKRRYVGRAVAG